MGVTQISWIKQLVTWACAGIKCVTKFWHQRRIVTEFIDMGPMKGHDVHLHLHIHGLASNSQRGPAWLQACTSPPASASLRVGTADMSHATWLIFFLRSICLFTLHTCYKPTITKDPGALVPAGRFFILFLSEHQPSVYDPCLTCYFSNWSGDYQRLLWYIGMLSVGSIYFWDRKLARLPQCSTVFFDLSML